MNHWYDRKGRLLVEDKLFDTDRPKWTRQMKKVNRMLGDRNYKIVKQEHLWWGGWLSTVWLGLNQSFLGGTPIIFESMMFFGKSSDIDMERYATEMEAYVGHEKMKKKWSNPIRVGVFLVKNIFHR